MSQDHTVVELGFEPGLSTSGSVLLTAMLDFAHKTLLSNAVPSTPCFMVLGLEPRTLCTAEK